MLADMRLLFAHAYTDHRTYPPWLGVQLTSTFVGHCGVGTQATHLALGPVGDEAQLWSARHDHRELDPIFRSRECAYEHIQLPIEHLREHGVQAAVDIDDHAFDQLERVKD
jgi:hypothetical protein